VYLVGDDAGHTNNTGVGRIASRHWHQDECLLATDSFCWKKVVVVQGGALPVSKFDTLFPRASSSLRRGHKHFPCAVFSVLRCHGGRHTTGVSQYETEGLHNFPVKVRAWAQLAITGGVCGSAA